jgi:hypothetical protein
MESKLASCFCIREHRSWQRRSTALRYEQTEASFIHATAVDTIEVSDQRDRRRHKTGQLIRA